MSGPGAIRVAPQVAKQLAVGENVKVQLHSHPMVLARPVSRALLGALVWFWIATTVPGAGRLLDLATIVVLVLLAWVLWCEFERRNNWLVVTEKRIFRTEGIFIRSVPMMRLSKVTDVTYRRNVSGRLFGYGLIVIESAGQDQALHDLNFIPYPEGTDALKAALFGEVPRDRDDDGGRWKPLRRKGRGKGGSGGGRGPGQDPGGPADPSGGSGTGRPSSPEDGGSPGNGPNAGGSPSDEPDVTAYDDDPTDVPPAGYPSNVSRRPAYGTASGTIYTSRRPSSGQEDTGPIPIRDRPRRSR